MGQLISLKARIAPKIIDVLLDQGGENHTYIHRLRAEARNTYGVRSDTYQYINSMLVALEQFINQSSRYFEAVQDIQADFSICGNLPEKLIEERITKMQQRLTALRERRKHRIIAIPVRGQKA
jgi:hypothetical protein